MSPAHSSKSLPKKQQSEVTNACTGTPTTSTEQPDHSMIRSHVELPLLSMRGCRPSERLRGEEIAVSDSTKSKSRWSALESCARTLQAASTKRSTPPSVARHLRLRWRTLALSASRADEYAGHGANEPGNRIRVADASSRVELPNRQHSKSSITRGHQERLGSLVEGWSGIATISVLGEGRVSEIEDVDVKMDGQGASREVSQRRTGSTGWIGSERFTRGHLQAEPGCLLPFPFGGHSWLNS